MQQFVKKFPMNPTKWTLGIIGVLFFALTLSLRFILPTNYQSGTGIFNFFKYFCFYTGICFAIYNLFAKDYKNFLLSIIFSTVHFFYVFVVYVIIVPIGMLLDIIF